VGLHVYLCVLVSCRLSTNKLIKRFISHIRSALYIDRHERRRVASRETESAQQATELIDSRGNVIVDAQNREKLVRFRKCRSLVPAGDVQRETADSKGMKLIGSRGNVTVYAQNREKLVRLRTCRSLVPAGGAKRERETECTAGD
jgi:hypothetical protein